VNVSEFREIVIQGGGVTSLRVWCNWFDSDEIHDSILLNPDFSISYISKQEDNDIYWDDTVYTFSDTVYAEFLIKLLTDIELFYGDTSHEFMVINDLLLCYLTGDLTPIGITPSQMISGAGLITPQIVGNELRISGLTSITEVKLISLNGRVFQEISLRGDESVETVPLESLARGVYFLQLVNEKQNHSFKFIK